ncbi:MAG: 6-bladed beta-propeller [Bacteroidales bacterium]|jgi:hypothetical protein|nr:6-bladed beta-propeller [Bacteroidales bacterium]
MARNKILITFIVIVLIITGCKHNPNEIYSDALIIDIESNVDNFKNLSLSQLNANIRYIPLQSTSGNFYQSIHGVDMTDSLLIVKAINRTDLYLISGKYIRGIGSHGKGPEEIAINGLPRFSNDKIYIPDCRADSKLHCYSTTGEFLKAIPFPSRSFSPIWPSWMPFNDTTFLVQVANINRDIRYRIAIITQQGDIVRGYGRNSIATNGESNPLYFGNHGSFYTIDNRVMFKDHFLDTLWEVSHSLIPRAIFHRGRYGIPSNYDMLVKNEFNDLWGNSIDILSVFETRDYILFRTEFKKHYPFDFFKDIPQVDSNIPFPILGVFCKQTHATFFVKPTNPLVQHSPTGLQNDIDGGINFFPQFVVDGGGFISVIQAANLKDYVATDLFRNSTPKYPERKRELEALANRLKDDDNPVLMVVTFEE